MEVAKEEEYKPQFYKPAVTDLKLKMLIYGPPGVGKTTLACTSGDGKDTSPAVVINIEGGLLSVSNKMGNIDVVDYKGMKELENTLWYLAKTPHKYKTLIIDSLSELQAVNIEAIVKSNLSKVSSGSKRRESIDDIWQEDYQQSTGQLRRFVRAFRDLPMHVIITCHDTTSVADNVTSIHPALTPKLRQSVIGYMDIVGYLFTKEVQEEKEKSILRRMLIQPMGVYTAKDRSPGGKLGIYIDNPTIPSIMKSLHA